MILRRSSRTDPRLVLGLALALALPLGADLAAFAQTASGQAPAGAVHTVAPATQVLSPPAASAPDAATVPAKADIDVLKEHDQELDATRARERASAESQAKLKREIDALGDDRRALNQQLIDTAARVRDVEASITAAQARLKPLDDQESSIGKSLDERRAAIVEILAALQRVGRQPPPALLVQPEDALRAVRTAITLGAVLPDMRAQADALAADLTDLLRVRRDIVAERERLARDLDLPSSDRLHALYGELVCLAQGLDVAPLRRHQGLDVERPKAKIGHPLGHIIIEKARTGFGHGVAPRGFIVQCTTSGISALACRPSSGSFAMQQI